MPYPVSLRALYRRQELAYIDRKDSESAVRHHTAGTIKATLPGESDDTIVGQYKGRNPVGPRPSVG
jgi:hypothetical protein